MKRGNDSFLLNEIYSVCRSQNTNYCSSVSEYEKQINKLFHLDKQWKARQEKKKGKKKKSDTHGHAHI